MNSSSNRDDHKLLATSICSIDSEISSNWIDNEMLKLRNTNNVSPDLVAKLAGDVVVASGVTLGIAPFMSIIDKSVVQRAAGTHTIFQSSIESMTTIVRNPMKFVKSPTFLMMWGVYAATYTSANCLKTIVEHKEQTRRSQYFEGSEKASSSSLPNLGSFGVFAITTGVNSATSMMKDRFYARQFGVTASKMPTITYFLWGLRDCMVIGSSFILPEYMSNSIQQLTDLDRTTSLQISQLTCPLLAQVVATPAQMLGLDFYNRPLTNLSLRAAALDRLRFQFRNFSSILGARIIRIAPSYGIGGIGNTHFREKWRNYVCELNLSRGDLMIKI